MTRYFPVLPALVLAAACAAQTSQPAPATAESKPAAKAATAANAASPGKRTCTVHREPPSAGELLLAKEDYAGARTLYAAQLDATPGLDTALLGLVDAMVGLNDYKGAMAMATAYRDAHPKSALGQLAVADAAYRAGDIRASMTAATYAHSLDPCLAGPYVATARLYDGAGLYAQAKRGLDVAHQLAPTDDFVERAWIAHLPRKAREEELNAYLGRDHALSVSDEHEYQNALTHLRAHRAGECHVTSKSDSTTAPMQPVYGDHNHPVAFGLDVLFNGKRRRMQIDTGASGITLTQAAAHGLGLQAELNGHTGGVGDQGEASSYLTHVASIRIGDVEVADCIVDVVKKSKLDVDGLIGMDVFYRWLVTLDYQDAKLLLKPLPPRPANPASVALDDAEASKGTEIEDDGVAKDRYVDPSMKDFGSIMRIGHNILLPAARGRDTPLHYLIMDTGASESTLSPEFAKEAGKLHGSDTTFVGLSGEVKKVYETDRMPLIVGNLVLPPTEYYAFDVTGISHDLGFETGGLFGLPTLQRLTIQIDYRDNLIKLSYDPSRDLQRF